MHLTASKANKEDLFITEMKKSVFHSHTIFICLWWPNGLVLSMRIIPKVMSAFLYNIHTTLIKLYSYHIDRHKLACSQVANNLNRHMMYKYDFFSLQMIVGHVFVENPSGANLELLGNFL